MKKALLLVISALLLINAAVWAAPAAQFSPTQKAAIEKIVHDYLVQKPEVLVEASRALESRQQQVMQKRAEGAIKANRKELFQSNSPTIGDSNAKVNFVEFFDYQCVHCRKLAPVISKLMERNKNVRFIFKELPILGPGSMIAAKAALAANIQGKYSALHKAMLNSNKRLTQESIMTLAKSAGLDVGKLKQDMGSAKIKDELQANLQLAEKVGIMGTPAVVIATNTDGNNFKAFFLPGAKSLAQYLSFIKRAQ